MKTLILVTLSLLLGHLLRAQTSVFPRMECAALDGRKVTLPGDNQGRRTVLGMAFSQKAEKELSGWFQPAYSLFIEKADPNAVIPMDSYDVNCYFVPVFSGVLQAAAGKAEKKMKEGLDQSLRANVLLYKGKSEEIRNTLKIDKTDSPWFFVVDTDGKVLYSTSGAYTEAKMEEIEKALNP
jgi:hypothetical protein